MAYRHAERENGIWKYATSMQKTMGPFHPSNRSTFLSVSSSGRLRILWQLPDGRWSQKDTELRSVSNLDLTITHATFASTTGTYKLRFGFFSDLTLRRRHNIPSCLHERRPAHRLQRDAQNGRFVIFPHCRHRNETNGCLVAKIDLPEDARTLSSPRK